MLVTEGRIRDLDPRFALTSWDTKLSRLVAPGLTSIDQLSLEPKLELAESLAQLDDVTWEVVVRADARFCDGRPVTARDVAYTFESAMDESLGAVHREVWRERFARIEVVDDRRVRFHLVEPVATLPADLDFGIVSRDAALAAGGGFGPGRVIGAGPYYVAVYWGDRLWLQRNEHYHGARPPTPFIDVRTIRDANARLLMLVGGDADLAQNSVRLDLIDAVRQRPRLRVESGPSAILTYLLMNNDDERLRDVRVRKAIAHAIDRRRIIAAKLDGLAVEATGLLPTMHWAYHGAVTRYGYDPARARALLDDAGFPDPDGPGGEPRLRLVYKTSSNQFRLAIARVIASQLAEVGIDVEVRSFEFGTFFTDVKRGNYQIATLQTGEITDPDHYHAHFHSSRIPHPGNWGIKNRWRYRNARVDELTEQGRRVADRARRLEIYREVQEIVAADVPIIPLWHEDNVAVISERVLGYELYPHARLRGLERATVR